MTMPSFPQMSLLQYVGASHVLGEYPAEPDLFGTDEMWANSGCEMHDQQIWRRWQGWTHLTRCVSVPERRKGGQRPPLTVQTPKITQLLLSLACGL